MKGWGGSVAAAAAEAASVVTSALQALRNTSNSNLTTLGAGVTWTGTWTDTEGYSQIVTSFKADQAGEFSFQFSSDGVTADRTVGPYTLAASTDSPQTLAPVRRYYRAAYTNTSGVTSNLRIETRLAAVPGSFQTRVSDLISRLSPAILSRSVLFGATPGGVYQNVGVSNGNALNVEVVGPTTAFGEVLCTALVPRVQIDAIYGLLTSDHETFTSGTGAVTAAASLFSCSTGAGVGAYGVLRSRRLIRYRPGQGTRARFTALFTTGVASSIQGAGMFTSTDGLFFGYSGTAFGCTRRIAGAAAIRRLTITTGSAGAENVTVKLNGVDFVVASGGLLSTTGLAERLSEVGVFTGWTAAGSPSSNGATVTFVQNTPAAVVGAFSLTSSGSAAGTFSTIQVGEANDDATGFVAQTDWNADNMDGTGSASNPSGLLLDPTKLNVYEVTLPYLGAGAIEWRMMTPTRHMVTVHCTRYPGSAVTPSQRNPTYRLGWFAASLGSSTSLTVKGASAAGFVEGEPSSARDPYSSSLLSFTAGTTEYLALAFRVRGDFVGTVNQREVLPQAVVVGSETATRLVRVRLLLNPTLTGTTNWGYVDETLSCVERTVATNLAPTGGREVATMVVTSTAASIDLSKLDLRLEPGDVLAIAMSTSSSTAVCATTMNWQEK